MSRMLDKSKEPTIGEIKEKIKGSWNILVELEDELRNRYDLKKELRFPFGNNYGWGYKYAHKANHLVYVFFEDARVVVMMQLGDNCVPKIEENFESFLPQTKKLWEERYPCGDHGGWINYPLTNNKEELNEVLTLIGFKKKPINSGK